MRAINFIVLHWLGDADSRDYIGKAAVERIRHMHMTMKNPYRDIGYHYLIDRNGGTYEGRPVEEIGAHAQGFNTGSIGVNFMFGADDLALTPAAVEAGRALLAKLAERHGIRLGPDTVVGHNDLMATACPGIVSRYIPEMIGSAGSAGQKPKNENINSLTIEGPGGSVKGLMLNSQSYVYIRDLAKILPEYAVEWDGAKKIAKLRKR